MSPDTVDSPRSPVNTGKRKPASTKEAAEFLGYHEDTVAEWRRRPDLNGLAYHRSPSGRYTYEWDDLLAWKRRYRKEPGA